MNVMYIVLIGFVEKIFIVDELNISLVENLNCCRKIDKLIIAGLLTMMTRHNEFWDTSWGIRNQLKGEES